MHRVSERDAKHGCADEAGGGAIAARQQHARPGAKGGRHAKPVGCAGSPTFSYCTASLVVRPLRFSFLSQFATAISFGSTDFAASVGSRSRSHERLR